MSAPLSRRIAASLSRPLGKVQAWHLDRLAIVYVRQSSRQQVLEHSESTRLQYGLVERARALGWAASRIVVIDEDLGRSAASAVDRTGFQRLVTEITMDRVGLVLGIEMSRLARAGRDWHQLVELCSLARTLLADADGVYDPNEYNDRLLLGLKGTMSEVELHLIKQRMRSGVLAKAERGELALALPAGYVRRPSGEAALDPDEQVQAMVRMVFRLFADLGTINAVLRYLAEHQLQLGMRERTGPDKGEVVWRRPNRNTLQNLLHSPIYAGVYVYGRSRYDSRRHQAGHPYSGRVRVAADDWLVWIPNVLPAYISLDRYERNQQRLASNQAQGAGVPRAGAALLGGLVRCGLCGQRMAVTYQVWGGHSVHSYVCTRENVDHGGERCQRMAGVFLDEHVAARVLAAVRPAALELAAQAAAQLEAERAELDRLWRRRLERASYNADLARRRYQKADPDNRLVVRQLEADWEQALAEHANLRDQYARFGAARPANLTAQQLDAIVGLARDIPALWGAPTTTTADRKELLRCVVQQVTVAAQGESERVHAEITWAGGGRESAVLARPVARLEQLSYFPRLAARVTELAGQGLTAAKIAEIVNDEGLRPPKRSETYTTQSMRSLLQRLGLRQAQRHAAPATAAGPDEWTLQALAAELEMPEVSLYSWLQRGWVTARLDKTGPRPRWLIHADQAEIQRLRALHALPRGWHNRRRWEETDATIEQGEQT